MWRMFAVVCVCGVTVWRFAAGFIIFAWLLLDGQRMAVLSSHLPLLCIYSELDKYLDSDPWLLGFISLGENDTMKDRQPTLIWGQQYHKMRIIVCLDFLICLGNATPKKNGTW